MRLRIGQPHEDVCFVTAIGHHPARRQYRRWAKGLNRSRGKALRQVAWPGGPGALFLMTMGRKARLRHEQAHDRQGVPVGRAHARRIAQIFEEEVLVRRPPSAPHRPAHGRHPKTFTKPDSSVQQIGPLFDHLVGALLEEQRHFKPERLRGLEIDHYLELNRHLHR